MWHKCIFFIVSFIAIIGVENIEAHQPKSRLFPVGKRRIPSSKRWEPAWIVGGKNALAGQFTYAVSLQFDEVDKCGGGIIRYRYIVTAAHCVIGEDGEFSTEKPTVLMNIIDLYADEISENQVDVEKIYVLEDYKPRQKINKPTDRVVADIAVIKLVDYSDKKLSTFCMKLKLPKDSTESYDGVIAIVVGFGWDSIRTYTDRITKKMYESGQSSGQLRYAETQVISNDECSKVMSEISDSNICAKVKQQRRDYGEGVCSGDSGGPLVYDGTLIGILSTSPFGCHETKGSGVYTRVSSYLDFIKAALANNVSENIRAKSYIQ